MYAILIYDIADEGAGARISRNIFKICKRYLSHVQKSVFEGEISESQLVELRLSIKSFIRTDLDSVILFTGNNPKWLKKQFWGIEDDATSNML